MVSNPIGVPSGGLEAYVSLETTVAFAADATGMQSPCLLVPNLVPLLTGTVDTDADGNVTVVTITTMPAPVMLSVMV